MQLHGPALAKPALNHSSNGNGTASHGRTRTVLVRRPKKRDQTLLHAFCAWLVEHQIGLSINLILLLFASHALFPRARPFTSKFFRMQYYHAESNTYTEGWDDAYFVLFWIVLFTGLRTSTMDYLLTPLASAGGIASKKGRIRFAEQGWQFLYYIGFWTLGMYIMYHSPYWFNLPALWTATPVRAVSPLMKWYYMVQFAFWLQQLYVVNIEEPRKDHWQMFTHHVFTAALMLSSYASYQTRAGNIILCIMDVVDILLPFAKLLNYLNWRMACDIAFGIFMVTWLVARHFCYLLVCWSTWADFPATYLYGCYEFTSDDPTVPGTLVPGRQDLAISRNIFHAFAQPEEPVCFNNRILNVFLSMLLALQILTLIWFFMIVRVAYGVVMGKAAEDSRSDDEAEDELEEVEVEIPVYEAGYEPGKAAAYQLEGGLAFQTEEVSADGLYHVKRRAASRRSSGRASGISIPGHGDHKELLGRVGCDKPS